MHTDKLLKLFALSILSATSAAGAQPAAIDKVLDPIDGLFGQVSSPATPGCSVAAARAGRTLLERAYGSANLEHQVRNTTATLFEAGSASKQFTAAAILLLAEEGKLSLSDNVRKYLPELPDYGDIITIDHLLNHTSGMRDWRFVFGLAGWFPGTRVHTNADALDASRRQRHLNHRPGAEYSYTNTGYSLAAIIAERVSGKSLSEFTKERIFAPLKMDSTQWRNDFTRVVKGRATAYRKTASGYVQEMPFENTYGHAGLLTTPHDLIIWNEALDRRKLGQFVTEGLQEAAILNDRTTSVYSRGLFSERYRGALEIGHGGVTGGYIAFVARYPEHQLSVAVLCNGTGDVNPRSLAHGVVDQFLPANSPPDSPDPKAEAARMGSGSGELPLQSLERWQPTADELAHLVGRYTSDEVTATYATAMENGRLVLRLEGVPVGKVDILLPTYRDRFVFSLGSLRFNRGKLGEPQSFEMSLARLRSVTFTKMQPVQPRP